MDPSKGISSSVYIQESNSYLGANLHFTEYTGVLVNIIVLSLITP